MSVHVIQVKSKSARVIQVGTQVFVRVMQVEGRCLLIIQPKGRRLRFRIYTAINPTSPEGWCVLTRPVWLLGAAVGDSSFRCLRVDLRLHGSASTAQHHRQAA